MARTDRLIQLIDFAGRLQLVGTAEEELDQAAEAETTLAGLGLRCAGTDSRTLWHRGSNVPSLSRPRPSDIDSLRAAGRLRNGRGRARLN